MENYKYITIRVTEEERRRLKILAAKGDSNVSELVRAMIQGAISTYPKEYFDR